MAPDAERRPNENEGAAPKSTATTTSHSLAPPVDVLAGLDTLTEAEAARLTTKIQLRLGMIADSIELVIPMIEEAKNGNAHQALGYESWTAYVADKFGGVLARLTKSERLPFVELLAGQGMSTRAIASVVGVSGETVRRDVFQPGANNVAPAVTGLDGKTYQPRRQAHVRHNSGDAEWYTPPAFIKAARNALGGIDLDPASCAEANEVVRAAEFYTAGDDGLTRPWRGRVWLNPPYRRPLIDKFCARLADGYIAGEVVAACALVNNGTETGWFRQLAEVASAVCFPRRRVRFWHPDKDSAAPLQGQAVLYLGPDAAAFHQEFGCFGMTWVAPEGRRLLVGADRCSQ